jgi:hypothetical protein
MAFEPFGISMISKGYAAIVAHQHFAAGAANNKAVKPPPVVKKDCLFIVFNVFFNLMQKLFSENAFVSPSSSLRISIISTLGIWE